VRADTCCSMANTGTKWNSDEIVKFLDIYEHHECLWNIRHSDYSSKLKRDSMMSKFMSDIIRENAFIENIECLRKKIKIIKNTIKCGVNVTVVYLRY
jgi:hypothetical protein